MRPAFVLLLLLALVPIYSAQAASTCPTCSELTDRPQAQITPYVNSGAQTLEMTVYYENLTTGMRPNISNAVLLLQVTPGTKLDQLYTIYTDSSGDATYNFSTIYDDPNMAGNCTHFKIVYCPFCIPATPSCGFQACLDYARISSDRTQYSNIGGPGIIQSIDDIPLVSGATVPATPNPDKYLPQAALASYCPAPAPMSSTPALCLPLILLFSLLSGALYVTGRNPFSGFNLGGARIGRHIRYQARGRGVSVSTLAIASAVETVKAAHDIKKKAENEALAAGKSAPEAKAAGWKALGQSEKAAASQRVFLVSDFKKGRVGVSAAKSASTVVAAAAQKAKEAGKPMTSLDKSEARVRHMESVLSGGVSSGLTTTGKGQIQLPSMGSIRGSEIMFTSKNLGAKGWAGVGGAFATMAGTLGKMVGFMVVTSPLFQLVEAVRMVATPAGSYKPLSEIIFVKHDVRAANDMKALAEMNAAGGTPVRLPNGQVATLLGVETLKDENGKVIGTKILLLADKDKAFTSDGMLTITIDNKGKIDSISCILKNDTVLKDGTVLRADTTIALMVNPKGGPMLKANPEMTTIKTGKNGQPVTVTEVNPNAKQIGTQPAPNQPQQDKLAWGNAAAPLYNAMNAIGGPSILASLGTSGNAFVKECVRDVNSVRAINSSLGSELSLQVRDIEKDVMKKYTPEQQKTMLAEERDKIATNATLTALGALLTPEDSRGLKASPFSNTGTFGLTLADQAGFNEKHGFTQKEVSAVGAALGSVIAGKSVADIAALVQNPEQLKSILVSALASQRGFNEAGAKQMLNESAVGKISAGITDAMHENARAPVNAVSNAFEHSPFASLSDFGKEKSEKAHFTGSQSQFIASYLAQSLGGLTLPQLEGMGKEPAKVKEVVVAALTGQLEDRLRAAGFTSDKAKEVAASTIGKVTILNLEKDPLAGGRTPTGDVATAISTVTSQLVLCGLGKGEARKEAESMVRGMSDPAIGGIATAISAAAQRVSTNLTKEGFTTPALVTDLKGVTLGQLGGMASASSTISPSTDVIKQSQFAEILAKDRSNPAIPADVKNMLERRESVLSAQAQSGQLAGYFEKAEKSGYIYMPAMSDHINSIGSELANSYNSQMATLISTDKTFKKLDTPAPETGRTIAGDLATGNEHEANATRLDRLTGEQVNKLVAEQPDLFKSSVTVRETTPDGKVVEKQERLFLGNTNQPPQWNPLLTKEEKIELLATAQRSQLGQLQNSLGTGDLATAHSVCAERMNFYRETGDATSALVWEKALTDIGALRREGGQPAPQKLEDISKLFIAKPIADREQQQRVEFKSAMDHKDLNAAATLASKQSEYYRNMGDTKTADAWDNAYKSVVGLPKEGGVSQIKVIELLGNIGKDAGSPETIAQNFSARASGAAIVGVVEAERASASYYAENALARASEVITSGAQPPSETKAQPVRMAAGGGGEPPKQPAGAEAAPTTIPTRTELQPPSEAKAPPPVQTPVGGGRGEEPTKPSAAAAAEKPATGVPAAGALTPQEQNQLNKFREAEADLMNPHGEQRMAAQKEIDDMMKQVKEHRDEYAHHKAQLHELNAAVGELEKSTASGLNNIARVEGREINVSPADAHQILSEFNQAKLDVVSGPINSYYAHINQVQDEIKRANDAGDAATATKLTTGLVTEMPKLQADLHEQLTYIHSHQGEVELNAYTNVVLKHLNIPQTDANVARVADSVRTVKADAEANSNEAGKTAYTNYMSAYQKSVEQQESKSPPKSPVKKSKESKEG